MRSLLALLLGLSFVPPSQAEVVDPAPFDSVLSRFVHGDRVAYGAMVGRSGPLRGYVAACETAKPDDFSRAEQIAFWVNAYNARVLEGVLRRPGLENVLDLGRAGWIPNMLFFRERRMTAGRERSLDDIEGRILARFGDPRLHFVLVRGSASSPALPPRALTAANLEASLDAAARAFLADTAKNRLAADGWLELSSIFSTHRQDFRRVAPTLPAYVARYWPGELPARPPVRFLRHDWSLNGSW